MLNQELLDELCTLTPTFGLSWTSILVSDLGALNFAIPVTVQLSDVKDGIGQDTWTWINLDSEGSWHG